ncbi:UvrB/UvrC motif-containing protein [Alicyclobacillus tolerans]|uniref:Protein arginine kinase activator n=1 Tax=Alicyclobacillus tolerans TaxID=90970 RepID=A0A1M6VMA8_9BACL|nr:UvrB/UvrC motif-containing protein [Alicyclobacillus montanus]SHK82633.1 protein arginine kinase activator [Alicyclobacillus montanus]
MLCQKCHERQANVHVNQIINGKLSALHLCEQCAKESGDFLTQFTGGQNPFDFHQLLSGLLNMESPTGVSSPSVSTQVQCQNCGMTYAQFSKVGRFGCPECYDNFEQRLEPLLRRIQSNTMHTGKVPNKSGERVKMRKTLETLRRELQQAIAAEQFEQAAQLRDKIRALESQMGE